MAKAPKQWCLTKVESISSFESWKNNLLYILTQDTNYSPYLTGEWRKKTKGEPLRGFTDDAASRANRKTAQQKVSFLELMLAQIANYCPTVSRNSIIKNSTSLTSVWHIIRLHYGFQTSGSQILDFANFQRQSDERPEDLYQRIVTFMEDNLLSHGGGITHHGQNVDEDEEMSQPWGT